MANMLGKDKQIAVTAALAEGNSIRSIERMTGIHRDTIMRLGVRIGQGCARLLDQKMRNLSCQRIQVDEVWSYVGKHDRFITPEDDAELGSVWTFCAIDSDSKIVLHFASYNFVRRHASLRMTPAMAAGITRDFWSYGELVEAANG